MGRSSGTQSPTQKESPKTVDPNKKKTTGVGKKTMSLKKGRNGKVKEASRLNPRVCFEIQFNGPKKTRPGFRGQRLAQPIEGFSTSAEPKKFYPSGSAKCALAREWKIPLILAKANDTRTLFFSRGSRVVIPSSKKTHLTSRFGLGEFLFRS